jgi:hypothetical protein
MHPRHTYVHREEEKKKKREKKKERGTHTHAHTHTREERDTLTPSLAHSLPHSPHSTTTWSSRATGVPSPPSTPARAHMRLTWSRCAPCACAEVSGPALCLGRTSCLALRGALSWPWETTCASPQRASQALQPSPSDTHVLPPTLHTHTHAHTRSLCTTSRKKQKEKEKCILLCTWCVCDLSLSPLRLQLLHALDHGRPRLCINLSPRRRNLVQENVNTRLRERIRVKTCKHVCVKVCICARVSP